MLSIKIVGPTGLHLSVLGLPGLISTAREEQTEADVETVHRMVDSYIQKPRTVILATIQANSNVANQSIIRESKTYARPGIRIDGIIRKSKIYDRLGTCTTSIIRKPKIYDRIGIRINGIIAKLVLIDPGIESRLVCVHRGCIMGYSHAVR